MTRVACIKMMHCIKMNSSKWVCIRCDSREFENREKILFLEAVVGKPSVCLCFGGVVIDMVLLISVGSTRGVYFIEGIGTKLAYYRM